MPGTTQRDLGGNRGYMLNVMNSSLEKLLSVAGPSYGPGLPSSAPLLRGPIGEELRSLLTKRDGFYAFESALHVRSYLGGAAIGLGEWNSRSSWRRNYQELTGDFTFFAEDIFGVQFAFDEHQIVVFDPETGEVEHLASGLESWASAILQNHNELTGYDLAHRWQQQYGRISTGQRLMPKRPFVLGGEFEVANVYALPDVDGMRLRGDLAVQIRDLPDGATVQFTFVD